MHPRTPVLVGFGVADQRSEDPGAGCEPFELMARSLRTAAERAEAPELLARADAVLVPRGTWSYRDPGRLVAASLGATRAMSTLAEVGVLQTELLGLAAREILEGAADVVLVTGGETKHRATRAWKLGKGEPVTRQPDDVSPDRVLAPGTRIMHPLEIESGLLSAPAQYAMIETALRHAEGRTPAEQSRRVAEVWSRFSEVAAANPHAWSREAVSPEAIERVDAGNRMIVAPYAKVHVANWNVDQAAGLIFCSLETARSLRIGEERMVFPLAVADANHLLPLVERAEPARCPGFAETVGAALLHAKLDLANVDLLELYSCFPCAVLVQARELGLDEERPWTVTGGMHFAGGPLNNFVLQGVARMAEILEDRPGATGMVSAVSTVLTKQGCSLWASRPPEGDFAHLDVTERVREVWRAVPVDGAFEGRARVAGYGVEWGGDGPVRGFALCDGDDGRRTIATSEDAALLRDIASQELCGREVTVASGRTFTA